MYTTQYAAAMTANNVTYDDLMPGAKKKYDQVVKVEGELKEIRESLGEAEPADKPDINENINRVETILATLDKDLVTAINRNQEYKGKMAKVAAGKEKKKLQKQQQKNNTGNSGTSGQGNNASASNQPGSTEEGGQQSNNAANNNSGDQANNNTGGQHQPASNGQQTKAAPVVNDANKDKKDQKKKNRKTWGIIGGLFAAASITFLGFKAHENHWWPFTKKK